MKPTIEEQEERLADLLNRQDELNRAERSELNRMLWAQKNAITRKPAKKPVSTVVGKKQRMEEFREMLLSPVTGEHVIRKTIEIALNDEHPGQLSALKMCMDRMLPTSLFDEKKDNGRVAVQITISGIGESTDVIDAVDNITDV